MINNSMKYKYCASKNIPNTTQLGRPVDPSKWISGPDPLSHDKYYAWLKHRAQARYRHEQYDLTWEEWETLWPDNLFLQRGRKSTDLCLARVDWSQPWSAVNCHIVERKQHLKRNGEFRKLNGQG